MTIFARHLYTFFFFSSTYLFFLFFIYLFIYIFYIFFFVTTTTKISRTFHSILVGTRYMPPHFPPLWVRTLLSARPAEARPNPSTSSVLSVHPTSFLSPSLFLSSTPETPQLFRSSRPLAAAAASAKSDVGKA